MTYMGIALCDLEQDLVWTRLVRYPEAAGHGWDLLLVLRDKLG
jgi:hypothetical protein